MAKRIRKRMYGVSQERVGMIAGTLAYSRKAAIKHFLGGDYPPAEWEQFKANGYRTVMAEVRILRVPANHQ